MKYPCVFLFLTCIAFAQPNEYLSRGVAAYLVNYGAVNGDGFKAAFAAKRFALIDEGSSADISLMHKTNPALPILVYKDIVATYPSFPEYALVNRSEPAFLHSADPASLIVLSKNDTAIVSWIADRRELNIKGYELTWFDDSTSMQGDTLQQLFTDTKAVLTKMGNFLEVRTFLDSSGSVPYSFRERVREIDPSRPYLALREVDTTIFTDTSPKVRITITLESLGDSTPDSVVIAGDFNRDNVIDTLHERGPCSRSGQTWTFEKTISLPDHSNGGYEFLIFAYAQAKRECFPEKGCYGTNVNNRIMNDYYGFYVMDAGQPAWRNGYIDQVKNSFAKYGYNGLFEDDTWYRIESWGVDAFPPVGYEEYTWRRNLFAFLDSIKANIAPRPAYFNGLYANVSDSLLLHTDGGMTEGFAYTSWSGYVTGDYWKTLCDLGLKAQHQYRRTWLALGGAPAADADARMYALASYLLAADSLSMYATATDYQEFSHFPEFDIPLGKPINTAVSSVDELKQIFLQTNTTYYVREFEFGTVIVNPDASKSIVYNSGGRQCVTAVGGLTIDSGRIVSAVLSDTIGPKQSRIYLRNSPASAKLFSPVLDRALISPNPAPADGVTNITVRINAYDPSSTGFFADSTKPLFIIADAGAVGGPKELQLLNDGSPAANLSAYSASFTMPVGAQPKGADLPIAAYSTTGLVSIVYAHLDIVSADSANLILNYSFEIDNDEDGFPDVWRPYGKGFDYDISGVNAETGTRSVHVANDSLSESRGVYVSLKLNQSAPEDIELSGWSKAVNVSGAIDNDYALYVDVQYQDGTPLYGQTAPFSCGSHDWEYSTKIIQPAKPIKSLSLYALFRRHTGEAWFDQIGLRPYVPPNAIDLAPAGGVFAIDAIYPSPAWEVMRIQYSLSRDGAVSAVIYSALGKPVRKISDGFVAAGTHTISFNVNSLSEGVYYIRFISDAGVTTRKVYLTPGR